MNSSSNLKSPKQLFEEKRLQALAELEYQKIKEVNDIVNKKVLPPKFFFNETTIEDLLPKEEIVEEVISEVVREVVVDPQQEQIALLQSRLEELQNSIPEEVNLDEVFVLIENLKSRIDNLPKPKDYSKDLQEIRSDLNRVEDSIPIPEVFDPSDLYKNISLLKNKIDEVRSEIPEVPQPILYDEELEELKALVESVRDSIPVVPEVRYYEDELNSIIEVINQVRSEIPELPEIKYYDEQIAEVENRLEEIQNSIPEVPEVKYYDEEVKDLQNKIEDVKNSFPEVKYYDEDVKDLHNKIEEVKNFIPQVKSYDEDVKDLHNKIEKVRSEIPEVPEVKYYDDDIKVLESIIDDVKSSIPEVPEVKYYDDQIGKLNEELRELYGKVSAIKVPNEDVYFQKVKTLYSSFEDKNHKLLEKINYLEEVFEKFNEEKILKEDLAEPPEVKNSDPLTPLNQNYVTLDQLHQHYKLFINRVQQQLATIGGGGETRLKYLDDVVGIATNASAYNNKFLKYNHSIGKFEFASVGAGSQNLDDTLQLGNTSSFGMSVGVTTVTSLHVDNVAHFDTNVVSINSSLPTQIYSFSSSEYRSAKIQIQITQGSDYQTSDVLIIHNGSSANLIEYASISTNDYLGTFDAIISGGNVLLQVLMASSLVANIKVVSQVIRV